MASSSRFFFDDFELRLDSGELLRGGSPVTTLQPQPARVLELLASRSGEVVGREEIRQLVWGESFVDFDASLNFCIKQIRRALGDSATSPLYLETLPRRGYRFLRPVRMETGTNGQEAPAPERAAAAPLPPPAKPAGWRLLTGVAATAVALVLLVFLIASRFPSTPSHPRLTVFPLGCRSAIPADRQICGGVTEALTAELTRRFPKELEVISSTSPLIYQGTRKSPLDVGRELGATHLITGTVDTSGGRLKIEARLATIRGKDLWHDSFTADLMDAPGVYERVARELAGALKLTPPPAAETGSKPSREASEAYLRGVYFLKQWRYPEAAKNLEEAVLLAPRFAPAYAALARARVELENPSQEDAPASRAAAERAIELDPRLPEAHLALANVLFKDLLDRDRAGAEYRQALVLDPGNAYILHDYAVYLVSLGRFDEAIAHVNRARELDPASMAVQSDLAWFLYLARRYDEAVREAQSTLKLLPLTQGTLPPVAQYGRSWTYWVLVHGSLRRGDEQTALKTIKERMKELGEGAATERIRSVQEILDWRVRYVTGKLQGKPGNSYGLAAANVAAGRLDEALGYLEQQCRNGGEGIMFNFVAVEPVFDPLRGDPRFARVVDCTGIPHDSPAYRAFQAKARAS
jgi:DNA-binding winged helix-turn-helix (wHTH) protein/Tfp pilus assembly protein PilF/TolB-like protein